MPKELLRESQQVVRLHKYKVSVVGNDMVNIALRGTDENPETGQIQAKGPSEEGQSP